MHLFTKALRSLGATLLFAALLFSRPAIAETEDDVEVALWKEAQVQLPPFPKPENLLPIYVSAATQNEFFVDGTSIAVGADGVVRYVLVIRTSGGAMNTSYEGMRCETLERRIYASGRLDGSWSQARNGQWKRIRDEVANRYHAALFQDYFCPEGVIVRNVEEARDALRRGRHPENRR